MSVLEQLSATSSFIKLKSIADKEVIDNLVFRFHYRATAIILIASCILCTANTLIGKPIDCIGDKAFESNANVPNSYCWISATFTIPAHRHQKYGVGTKILFPGVGPTTPEDNAEYHSYYQWVPFALIFQAILFYAPHWLWKNYEDGRIRKITDGLRGATTVTTEERKEKQTKLVQYILETMHLNNIYAYCYILCEALNFINAIGNIYFIDKFLGNVFLTYGTKVIDYAGLDQENRTDPMIEIFPRVTKCTFNMYGPTGTVQTHDLLCILPLNILNEKIYIFMWFWLIFLAVMSGLALIYSLAITFSPIIRKLILESRFKYKVPGAIHAIVSRTKHGDFFFLHLLGRNLCTMTFHEILNDFSSELGDYKHIL
ncbi:innexin inx3-like [Periplaneta americana]|uniref:innexin inx3-like n=1 Tax=Periplaneta americana TaxID=6978 RepID=UPI0037E9B5DC